LKDPDPESPKLKDPSKRIILLKCKLGTETESRIEISSNVSDCLVEEKEDPEKEEEDAEAGQPRPQLLHICHFHLKQGAI
jgi:hypothetical protein